MTDEQQRRKKIATTTRWVIKVGSSLITNDGKGIDATFVDNLVAQIHWLHQRGISVCIVSSGSIVEGAKRLAIKPRMMSELQATASVGQVGLVEQFEKSFTAFDSHTAQILLTHDDLANRTRYLNARSTIRTLLAMKAIPIINENDTIVTEEIKFGDNDTIAGLTANLIEAHLLVLLTDQQGIYTQDPVANPHAELVSNIDSTDPLLLQYAGKSRSGLGKGGMVTKVRSAQLAARSGATTIIASGKAPNVLRKIYQGEQIGSLLRASDAPITARRQWMAGQLRTRGTLYIDEGAARAVANRGVSLLPVGVYKYKGAFQRGDLVDCIDTASKEVARGLVNYSSQETAKIIGKESKEIENILGYIREPELIHRDNLVLM